MKKWPFLLLTIATLVVGGILISQRITPKTADQSIANIQPTATPNPEIKSTFSAWVASWDQHKTPEYLLQTNGKLKSISPLWYKLTPQGQVVEIPNLKGKSEVLNSATNSATLVIPTIINDFDGARVNKFLKSSSQSKQLDQLVDLAVKNDYAGWDIDWEQIKSTDKKAFSEFVADFSQKLHAKNLVLSISVHAQTGRNDWEGTKGQDYRTLGESADFIRIMTYDFHYENSDPGPVTPLEELTKVITYAKQTLPASKIVIGLPTYGYDWGPTKGEGLQYQDIINRLATVDAQTQRDASSGAMVSTYTKDKSKHQVWYEDYQSMLSKVALANSLGVTQFCFWRLGGEDIQFWQNIN